MIMRQHTYHSGFGANTVYLGEPKALIMKGIKKRIREHRKVSWDYMYMKNSQEGTTLTEEESGLPILVGIDSSSKM